MERANPINTNLSHTIEMVMLKVKKMTMIQKVVLMTHFVIVDNDGHSKLEKPARLTIRVFFLSNGKKLGRRQSCKMSNLLHGPKFSI